MSASVQGINFPIAVAAGVLWLAAPAAAQAPSVPDPLAWLSGGWTAARVSSGRFDLVWTAIPSGLRGVLEVVAPTGKREIWSVYEVIQGKDGFTLTLREGRRRYRFKGGLQSKNYLRFERDLTEPGPFAADIKLTDGRLLVRQVLGPQHGAALTRNFNFQRVPEQASE